MEIDFEIMFKIPMTALRITKSHPEVPRNKKWIIQFIFTYGLFTLIFIIMFYNMILGIQTRNYSEACQHFILNIVFYVISIQSITLIANQKTVGKMIDMMKADFAQDISHDVKKIVVEYARKGRKVSVIWMILVMYTGAMFPCKHMFFELYTYVTDDWQLLELYPMTYPSPIEEYKKHPLVFSFIYMLLMYYIVYAALVYIAFVPLGPTFMLHACGQFEIVKKKALALYVDSADEVEVRLKEIVKQLQYIYSFVECINHVFGVVYELTLQATSIILPLTLYEVLNSWRVRGEFSIEFVTFIVGGTLISCSPCYYSDKLMQKGEDVGVAMYSCGWERRYDHKVRTTLVLVLLRAQQTTAIRTKFRVVCLDALTDIFHQAYVIFGLMNAVWG